MKRRVRFVLVTALALLVAAPAEVVSGQSRPGRAGAAAADNSGVVKTRGQRGRRRAAGAKGDEVVAVLDNRSYGAAGDVKMSPGPGDEDLKLRMYAAEEMARLYYSFDRKTWEADKDKLVTLMMPDLAYGWAKDMKESREYQRRLAENWQATWTVQDKRFDDNDPYLVRIIGTQEVTKGQEGRTEKVVRQFSMEVKLFSDEAGPQPRNLNTGYRPSWFSEKELPVRSGAREL